MTKNTLVLGIMVAALAAGCDSGTVNNRYNYCGEENTDTAADSGENGDSDSAGDTASAADSDNNSDSDSATVNDSGTDANTDAGDDTGTETNADADTDTGSDTETATESNENCTGTAAEQWSGEGGNGRHNGDLNNITFPTSLKAAWQKKLSLRGLAGPLVTTGGNVIIAVSVEKSLNAHIQSYSPDGILVWQQEILANELYKVKMALGQNRIYVVNRYEENLMALDACNGEIVWQKDLPMSNLTISSHGGFDVATNSQYVFLAMSGVLMRCTPKGVCVSKELNYGGANDFITADELFAYVYNGYEIIKIDDSLNTVAYITCPNMRGAPAANTSFDMTAICSDPNGYWGDDGYKARLVWTTLNEIGGQLDFDSYYSMPSSATTLGNGTAVFVDPESNGLFMKYVTSPYDTGVESLVWSGVGAESYAEQGEVTRPLVDNMGAWLVVNGGIIQRYDLMAGTLDEVVVGDNHYFDGWNIANRPLPLAVATDSTIYSLSRDGVLTAWTGQ